jgi:hypothetical protein
LPVGLFLSVEDFFQIFLKQRKGQKSWHSFSSALALSRLIVFDRTQILRKATLHHTLTIFLI